MDDEGPFVAVGLVSETNLRMLGTSLGEVFPIPQDDKFAELVKALDAASGNERQDN